MKLLEFGMKHYRSRNFLMRFFGKIALKIATYEAERIEKNLKDKYTDLKPDDKGLEKIFEQINKRKGESQS